MKNCTEIATDFSHFIMEPWARTDKKEVPLAWAATIILGIFSIGLVQAACALYLKLTEKEKTTLTDEKTTAVFENILPKDSSKKKITFSEHTVSEENAVVTEETLFQDYLKLNKDLDSKLINAFLEERPQKKMQMIDALVPKISEGSIAAVYMVIDNGKEQNIIRTVILPPKDGDVKSHIVKILASLQEASKSKNIATTKELTVSFLAVLKGKEETDKFRYINFRSALKIDQFGGTSTRCTLEECKSDIDYAALSHLQLNEKGITHSEKDLQLILNKK